MTLVVALSNVENIFFVFHQTKNIPCAAESPDETYYGYVKPTLIYQTLEPNKKVKRYR